MTSPEQARRVLSERQRQITLRTGTTHTLRMSIDAIDRIEERYGTVDDALALVRDRRLGPAYKMMCWMAEPPIDPAVLVPNDVPDEAMDVLLRVIILDGEMASDPDEVLSAAKEKQGTNGKRPQTAREEGSSPGPTSTTSPESSSASPTPSGDKLPLLS